MKKLIKYIIAIIIIYSILFIITGCSEKDKGTNSNNDIPNALVGTVTGVITLPGSALGKMLIVVIDKDLDKNNEPEGYTTCVCSSSRKYEYTFKNYPIGLYYVYAVVYKGNNDEGPPQSGDYFGYYRTGLNEPSSRNVFIGINKTDTCDFVLYEIP